MRCFLKINAGLDFYGCPGIEAWFVKQVMGKYNYTVKFSSPDKDGVICVDTVQDEGLKPLNKLHEFFSVVLLAIADLKALMGKEYL